MEDVSPVLSAIKQLTCSTTLQTSEQGLSNAPAASVDQSSPLVHSLRSNLKSYKSIFSNSKNIELAKHLDHYSRNEVLGGCTFDKVSSPFSDYLVFAKEGLCLLSVLDVSLRVLDKKDTEEMNRARLRQPPPAPRALISVSDFNSVHSLIQFIVALGVFPHLLPGVDGPLCLRLSRVKSVEKANQMSNGQRSFFLYHCVRVLMKVFENPILGPSVLSQHYPDVLAALIQICLAPGDADMGSQSSAPSIIGDEENVCHIKEQDGQRNLCVASNSQSIMTPGDIGLPPKVNSKSSPPDPCGVPLALKDDGSLPDPGLQHPSNSSDVLTLPKTSQDADFPWELSPPHVEWCNRTLHKLLSHNHQPLVIRELLYLQSSSLRKIPKGMVGKTVSTKAKVKEKKQSWLSKVCGQLLSERLVDKNGVENVVKGIFSSTALTGDSWKKCKAVAKVIASCPSQVASVEEYYSVVCPQVLTLLQHSQGNVAGLFEQVAIATMSLMLSNQKNLSMRYLIKPLVEPLAQISDDPHVVQDPDKISLGNTLTTCIEDLHKVCTIAEPSSPLLASFLPYVPLVFEVWLAVREDVGNNSVSLYSKEIISRIIRSSNQSTIIDFLYHISHFNRPTSSSTCLPDNGFLSLHPALSLTCTMAVKEQKLTVRTQTEEENVNRYSIEEMERVGNGVAALLCTELKDENILGQFFLHCLQHLHSLISQQAGLGERLKSRPGQTAKHEGTTAKKATRPSLVSTNNMSRKQEKNSTTSYPADDLSLQKSTSLALLECESKLPTGLLEAYSNSLVLYIAAALCENSNSSLLEQTELPDLLSVLRDIVSCHAHCCVTVSEEKFTVLLAGKRSSSLLDEIIGGPITLSIALGLLSAIMGGAIEIQRYHRPLLAHLQPFLVTIATNYPVEELSSLANDLNICIATLGEVWTSELKMKKESPYSGSKQILSEGTTILPHRNNMDLANTPDKNMPTTSLANIQPSSSPVKPPTVTYRSPQPSLAAGMNMTSCPSIASLFQQALDDVSDPSIPVKGHGLISLSKLVHAKDKETLSNTQLLLNLFKDHVNHSDSYVYLSAINGLVSLASVANTRSLLISTLCQAYSLLSGPPLRVTCSTVDSETGQMKKPISFKNDGEEIRKAELKNESQSFSPTVPTSSNPTFFQPAHSVEVRMKLGEALVKVVKVCGELLPHFLDEIVASIFSNVKDPDPLIRASSLSNLADVCASVKFSFGQIQNEVLDCVTSILQSESEVKVRHAALVVLKLTIRGLSHDTVQVLGSSLHGIYHLLKQVESCDQDELTRVHAQAVLGELDTVMRSYIFPEPSKNLSKKISILDLV